MPDCIICGTPLDDRNWSPGMRRNKSRRCRSCHAARVLSYYRSHRDERRTYFVRYHRFVKLKALTNYGINPPECACCGIRDIEFLTLDHVADDGAEQRRKLFGEDRRNSRDFYFWLMRNNYPKDLHLQVLCWNCQWGKRYKGCPHQFRARWATMEPCYACGDAMIQVQTCRFQCPNCGALLDCEDVSGLPK